MGKDHQSLPIAKKSTSKRQGPPRGRPEAGRDRRNSNCQPLGQEGQAKAEIKIKTDSNVEQIREKTEMKQRQVCGDNVTNNLNHHDVQLEFNPEYIPEAGVRRSGRKRKERIVSGSSIDELVQPKKRNATKKNTNKRKRREETSSSEESGEVNSKNKTDKSYQTESELLMKYGGYYSETSSHDNDTKDDEIITINDTDSETEDVIDLLKEIPADSPSSSLSPSKESTGEEENYENELNYHDNISNEDSPTPSPQEMVPLELSVLLNPIDMSSYLWEIENVMEYFAFSYPQQKDKTKSRDFNAGKNIGLDSKWRLIMKRTNKNLDVFTLSLGLLELKASEDNRNQGKICAKISTSFINEKGQFYRENDFPIELLNDESEQIKDMSTAMWKKESIYAINTAQEIMPSFKIKDKYLSQKVPLKLNIYIMVYIYGGNIPQCNTRK